MLFVCPIGSEDKEQLMAATNRWTGEHLLAAFDEQLRRTRGLCAGTRRNYRRYAQVFLETVFAGGPVDVGAIHVRDVVGFVGDLTGRYQPRTAELAASALRSFFRFLRTAGLRTARLGLRASEVAQLRLDDLDWRNAAVRVRTRKTGHGALLPLTTEVGTALAVYLRDGRPGTPSRQVFV